MIGFKQEVYMREHRNMSLEQKAAHIADEVAEKIWIRFQDVETWVYSWAYLYNAALRELHELRDYS